MLFILIAIVIFVGWIISLYNGLVTLKNRVAEAWADIDAQLKRRYDLIPNLVATVKGYMSHEAQTLEKITNLRTQALSAQGVADKSSIENELSSTIKTLFAVSENYPDLKANEGFLSLQRDLTDTEDKILSARRFYNTNVRDYNTRIETFPGNIIASRFGFTKAELFVLSANEVQAKDPVKVAF